MLRMRSTKVTDRVQSNTVVWTRRGMRSLGFSILVCSIQNVYCMCKYKKHGTHDALHVIVKSVFVVVVLRPR